MAKRPLSERVKREFWRPETDRVWVRKELGWGWTINFAPLLRGRRRGGGRSA